MQNKLNERKITYLLHFTKYSNLPSIMTNGLVRRSELDSRGMVYAFNDDMRLDRHPNSLSVSIGFPNYRMFYPARNKFPDETWVVLVLSTDVLIHKPCAYYARNAATSCYNGVEPASLQNEASFDDMFADVGDVKRSDLGIPAHWTTDPQAEVLVFSDIERCYITGIATQNKGQEHETHSAYPDLGDEGVKHYPILFGARKDYRHWQ